MFNVTTVLPHNLLQTNLAFVTTFRHKSSESARHNFTMWALSCATFSVTTVLPHNLLQTNPCIRHNFSTQVFRKRVAQLHYVGPELRYISWPPFSGLHFLAYIFWPPFSGLHFLASIFWPPFSGLHFLASNFWPPFSGLLRRPECSAAQGPHSEVVLRAF